MNKRHIGEYAPLQANHQRTNQGHREKSGASLVKQSRRLLHGSGWELPCTQITQFYSCFMCNNKGVWDYRGAGTDVLNKRDHGRCSNRRLSKSDKNIRLVKTKNWNWYFCSFTGMIALNPSLLHKSMQLKRWHRLPHSGQVVQLRSWEQKFRSFVRRTFQSSHMQNGKQILCWLLMHLH